MTNVETKKTETNEDRIQSALKEWVPVNGFKPVGNRIMSSMINIQPVEKKGNLILPDTVKKQKSEGMEYFEQYPVQGLIVAINKKAMEEFGLSLGDHVFLRETHMDNIIYNKKLYWFCYPNDIIGIVENVQDMQKTEK